MDEETTRKEKRLNKDLSKSFAQADDDPDKGIQSDRGRISEENLVWKTSVSKEKAFANPVYSEAMPGRGTFGHYHQKMEPKENKDGRNDDEGRYEEVDGGHYINMGRPNGKDYYENYDFGENGIYQNILFKSKTEKNKESTQVQTGIKRNKSLRIACRIEEKEDDEETSELNRETFDSLFTPSSSILGEWGVEEESGRGTNSKGKTLFTSSERRLVAEFLRNMNTETSIS